MRSRLLGLSAIPGVQVARCLEFPQSAKRGAVEHSGVQVAGSDDRRLTVAGSGQQVGCDLRGLWLGERRVEVWL